MTWLTITFVVVTGAFAGVFAGRVFITTATNRFSRSPTARMPYNRNFATLVGGILGAVFAFKSLLAHGVAMGVFAGFLGGCVLPLLVYLFFIGEHLTKTKFWRHVFAWGDRIGDLISRLTIGKKSKDSEEG